MKGSLCGKNNSKINQDKCYCKNYLCLVNGGRSSGEVFQNGKPVCFKCKNVTEGDEITSENECVRKEIDCDNDNNINKASICEEFGFDFVNDENKQ